MQYKTTCNNCGREYMVDGIPGQTIKAQCPYCGAVARVVTPVSADTQNFAGAEPYQVKAPTKHKSTKPLYLRVTMWFLIIVTILFVLLTILYLVFSGMSK